MSHILTCLNEILSFHYLYYIHLHILLHCLVESQFPTCAILPLIFIVIKGFSYKIICMELDKLFTRLVKRF